MTQGAECLYTRRAAILLARYTVQKSVKFHSKDGEALVALMAACEANAHTEGYTVITYDNVLAQAKLYGYEEEKHG